MANSMLDEMLTLEAIRAMQSGEAVPPENTVRINTLNDAMKDEFVAELRTFPPLAPGFRYAHKSAARHLPPHMEYSRDLHDPLYPVLVRTFAIFPGTLMVIRRCTRRSFSTVSARSII